MPAFISSLLTTFGNTSANVQNCSNDAGKNMMAALSPHGVNDNWRIKKASAELLGAVSQLAPRQLSSCLPNGFPTLVELLTDSHHEVQKAGARLILLLETFLRIKTCSIICVETHTEAE
uniref:Uncharacterized protein n=1 Tax=Panagrolaimus sp. ES5 TaxID=591445 RepID=A0AC34GQA8_9BILA